MKGRLTERDMEMLEQWMCIGPKSFSLLYAIKRDGCNATTFHEKCDNQGPTVTVLYNLERSVYGGYTSARWNGCGHYITTNDSFLFQLHYVHRPKANKFPLKPGGYEHSIYGDSSYGPTFGGGYDLATFHGTINEEDGYFALNGYLHVGMSYDNLGIANDKINNGNMNVFELEVYRVDDCQRLEPVNPDDSKPWRKTEVWNDEYTPYTVEVQSGELLNFRFCDTPGIEVLEGISEVECNYLLDGNVPDYYQFNPVASISPKTPGFNAVPTPSDQIHCVPFVLDATTLEALSAKLLEKLERFKTLMNQKGIPQLVILTKIDKLCKEVENDVSFVFKSPKVGKCVKKAANLLGLPESNVLPVKNYDNEFEPEENINILALLSVRQILNFTEDFFQTFFLLKQKPTERN